MAGLLGLLDLGSGAIIAQNAGVAVAGRNTANVNTEGYSRESVNLLAQAASPLVGGVLAGDTALRSGDDLLSGRERQAAGAFGQSSALATASAQLVELVTPQGEGLVSSIGRFFGSINALAAAPTDAALRSQVVNSAEGLASAYQAIAASIAQAQAEADKNIQAIAQQASTLAQQLSHLNQAIATSGDPVLQDQRDLAARQLAQLTGGQARIDPDGQMRFVVGAGQVLVDGFSAASLQAVPDAANGGHLQLNLVNGGYRADLTSTLDGGQLAGQIAFRDGAARSAASALDQLAYDTASKINAVHQAGVGLDGNGGRDLFLAPTAVAGAAAAMAVDPAVAGDPSLVAAGLPGGGSGDSRNANALVALSSQLLAASGTATLSDQAIQIVGSLGSAARTATDQQSLDQARVQVVKSQRDSSSGVSTEEELARLAQFQHASEAASKFVSVVNDLLGTLINNL